MKHKYAITVEAPYVKADTEKLMREIARRNKAEFLGSRRLKSGDWQCGLSCTDSAFGKVKTAVSLTNNGNCLFRDCGEDDGERKPPKPTDAPKPAPKKVSRGTNERIPPIMPIKGAFEKWSDLGSDEHKRAIAILGAGCENRAMKHWGKFSIDRDHLFGVLSSLLKDDAELKRYVAKNTCRPHDLAEYVATSWTGIKPFVYRAFSKEDAEFIEWHTTHSGRRPANA